MAKKAQGRRGRRTAKAGQTNSQAKLDYLDAHIDGTPKDSYNVKCDDFTVADFCREIRRLAADAQAGTYMGGLVGTGYLTKIAKRVSILASLFNPRLRFDEPEEYDEFPLPDGKMQRVPRQRALTTEETRLSHLCWQAHDAARFFISPGITCQSKEDAIERLTVIADALAAGEPAPTAPPDSRPSDAPTQAIPGARCGPMKQTEIASRILSRPIFIGHGQSNVWISLRDFIVERLGLDYEEFNKEPSAGMSIADRLSEMLEKCRFAFLVLTAEDERLDGKTQARQNVVHEVGLCQAQYGLKRAIILLEEGCENFSNVQGLVYIPFPKGDILAKADEIRQVLEREDILPKCESRKAKRHG